MSRTNTTLSVMLMRPCGGLPASFTAEEHTRDVFRAAGYEHKDLEMYAQTRRKRIAERGAI